jgi:methylmalonyl-CoA/ethylmalonyl-CoA epimerase
MFERYTEVARRVIFFARYDASMAGSPAIEAEHLLLGMVREDRRLLSRFLPEGVGVDSMRKEIEERAPVREKIGTQVELPLAADAKRVLAYAHEESDRLFHRHIGPEHLLLGLLRADWTTAAEVLRGHGLELDAVRETLAGEGGGAAAGADERASVSRPGASNEPVSAESNLMKIDHIGIATRGLDDALKFWRDALGLEVRHTETVEEQGVRVAMLPVGEPRVELLEPTGPESPVAKFLEKRGPGIHHVAVRVTDIRASLARLKEKGARLIDETPRVGAGGCLVAFVHPTTAGGVLLELVEHTGGHYVGETEKR